MADTTYDNLISSKLTLSASDLIDVSNRPDLCISTTVDCSRLPNPYTYTYISPPELQYQQDFLKTKGDKKDMTEKIEKCTESYVKRKFTPERIVYNPPATIVFWKDKTKTVVKCSEGEEYSEYFGFLAALGKKIFETNSEVNRIVNAYKPKPKEEPKPEPKPKAKPVVKKKKESKKK